MPTGNQHLIRGPPLMWREGGTRPRSGEHNFSPLSFFPFLLFLHPLSFYSLSSVSPLLSYSHFCEIDAKKTFAVNCTKVHTQTGVSFILADFNCRHFLISCHEAKMSVCSQQGLSGANEMLQLIIICNLLQAEQGWTCAADI